MLVQSWVSKSDGNKLIKHKINQSKKAIKRLDTCDLMIMLTRIWTILDDRNILGQVKRLRIVIKN